MKASPSRATPASAFELIERGWRQMLRYVSLTAFAFVIGSVAYATFWSAVTHTPAVDVIGPNVLAFLLALLPMAIEQLTRAGEVGGMPRGDVPFAQRRPQPPPPPPPASPIDYGEGPNGHGGPVD